MLDAVFWALAGIMGAVAIVWCILIKSMTDSFRLTPRLGAHTSQTEQPRVSVILPARNEENFIAKCLDSLSFQSYANCEIVAVDDSSEDNTGAIISERAARHPQIVHVTARKKPKGWMGKNWACMEGYRAATGELLLFTDADTVHDRDVVGRAVGHLLSKKLDALTVIPRMRMLEFWTETTLPVISTFLHTRFSALRVNDPSKKTGYFFGSFFIIRKSTYGSVGMHEGVKQEIIEDGALGKKVKESGSRMLMVRAEDMVSAVWARDGPTLWNALKRLMVPLYAQNRPAAVGIFFAVLFLLFAQFPLLVLSGVLSVLLPPGAALSSLVLSSLSAVAAMYVGCAIECRELGARPWYAALCPLGGLVVVSGFLAGIIRAGRNAAVSWRGRTYSLQDMAQDSISL